VSPSLRPPEFFVDRSLGRHRVPEALRWAGWSLRTHHEVYGERDEQVADVEWLELCGKLGLPVLSKDRRIRYRPAEIEAVKRFGVRAFVLTSGSLRVDEQAARFERSRLRIEEASGVAGPALFAVQAMRLIQVFPSRDS
jgi:PIN like domain